MDSVRIPLYRAGQQVSFDSLPVLQLTCFRGEGHAFPFVQARGYASEDGGMQFLLSSYEAVCPEDSTFTGRMGDLGFVLSPTRREFSPADWLPDSLLPEVFPASGEDLQGKFWSLRLIFSPETLREIFPGTPLVSDAKLPFSLIKTGKPVSASLFPEEGFLVLAGF